MLSIISIVSINVSIINFEQINAVALKKLTLSLGVLKSQLQKFVNSLKTTICY